MVQPKYLALIIGAGGQGALADRPDGENAHKVISFAHALKEHHAFTFGFKDKSFKKVCDAYKIWDIEFQPHDNKFSDCLHGKTNPDLVIVSNPDHEHYHTLKYLFELYTPKLVICEKPLCANLDEAKEIVELYKKKNVPLLVNYTRRFIPELQDLKRRYQKGEFGRLIDGCAWFNRGMVHTGTHMIDFLQWFFQGTIDYKIVKIEAPYRIWQIQLYFENYFWQEQRIGHMPVPSYYDYHMRYVIQNAYDFLEGKCDLLCTGEDAIKSLEICNKFNK